MPETINQLILKNVLIGLAKNCLAQNEVLSMLTSEVAALREAVYEPGPDFDERQKEVEALGDTVKEAIPKFQKMLHELQDLIQ